MGSIFGIADLPVSIIGTTVQIGGGMDVPKPEYKATPKTDLERTPKADTFIPKTNKVRCSNPILKMRNGIGKLMKHFSKVRVK